MATHARANAKVKRVAGQVASGESPESALELVRELVTDHAEGPLDDVGVVEEPLRRGTLDRFTAGVAQASVRALDGVPGAADEVAHPGRPAPGLRDRYAGEALHWFAGIGLVDDHARMSPAAHE